MCAPSSLVLLMTSKSLSLWAESHAELLLGSVSVMAKYCLLKFDKRHVCLSVFGLDMHFCLVLGSWDLGLDGNIQCNI